MSLEKNMSSTLADGKKEVCPTELYTGEVEGHLAKDSRGPASPLPYLSLNGPVLLCGPRRAEPLNVLQGGQFNTEASGSSSVFSSQVGIWL